MKPVELDPEAVEELREAIEFLESRRTGLGDEFEAAVQTALDLIGRQPKAFSPYRQRYRKYVVKRFGYRIFYVEFDDRVWDASISHGRREPDTWTDREPE